MFNKILKHLPTTAAIMAMLSPITSFAVVTVPELDVATMESAAAKVFVAIAAFVAVGMAVRLFKRA